MPITIKSKPDPKYGVAALVGSIDLDYDMEGSLLEEELSHWRLRFLNDMDKRGYSLVEGVPNNPKWVSFKDGQPKAYYAVDWEGKRPARLGPDGESLPRLRETSLEETGGMVEYRIVGVFYTPEKTSEILTTKTAIREAERASRNPLQFAT